MTTYKACWARSLRTRCILAGGSKGRIVIIPSKDSGKDKCWVDDVMDGEIDEDMQTALEEESFP